MKPVNATSKAYCNCLAQERGLDPIGYADDFEDVILLEVPLPWKPNLYNEAGVLPQECIDLLQKWLKDYHEGKGYNHRPLLIAPDKEYSVEGHRRVMFYTRKKGQIAIFDKVEYLVPVEKLGPLCWALYEDHDALTAFDTYRVPEHDATRDILVCTHGTIDAACAKFGYPLYNEMRKNYSSDHLRVWRVTHFGGHVFAPTLMDMPTAHYWAYVGEEEAEKIIHRRGDVADMRGHYRGWAGLGDSFAQTAECALWQQYGWDWFDFLKSHEVLARDEAENPTWVELRISYTSPDGREQGSADIRVEVSNVIETEHTTGKPNTYPYPQYKAVSLKEHVHSR
ncbi:sucrase ferredoxin [Phototrophicus methaneseepsis]|uniref:Sucrase ferredoxin n=1 Tax=Phototrophicus methaneseepsis TaxID=2710758 RepID=A0A7S8E7I5_9CHLR|nr:sucrase ferredoxin [Phototrophicus methaneseepsis]QPC81813.1 sucrase ferredoxin [Phototrophicus methaneseepsis]